MIPRMLLAGDEMGRTQLGNNNAYCQDNEVSWVDWEAAGKQQDLIDFTCALSGLRRAHPVFRRRRFFSGLAAASGEHGGLQDIVWLTPAGRQMTDNDWHTGYARSLGVFLNGDAITEPGPRGNAVRDQSFLLLFNANREPVTFVLPGRRIGDGWEVLVDTATVPGGTAITSRAAASVQLTGRSIMVLRGVGADRTSRRPY